MTVSPYQQRIYDEVLATTNNVVFRSTAGSGKTTTLVGCCKMIPYGKRVLFAAFNRHIVNELRHRLPPEVQCLTLHALGLKTLRNTHQALTVSDSKQVGFILPHFEKEQNHKERWTKVYETDRLLKLVRATMTPLTREAVELLSERHNLFSEEAVLEAVLVAGAALRRANEASDDHLTVDFQDMIELPVLHNLRLPQYDYVLLDEGQDFSKLDQLFIEKLVKRPGGRLIVAGDDRQAIYSFRGADVNSFQHFVDRPQTVKLPLTISYRCGKQIVAKAKQVYPEIEPWEENIDGVVRTGTLEEVRDGDLVLARNVRPLVHAFFKLVELGKKSTIIGKEIEKGLLAILGGLDGEASVEELNNHITNLKTELAEKLRRKGFTNPLNHQRYEALSEKVEIVRRISLSYSTVKEVEDKISSIFQDETIAPIKLMTIHKSKGLESRRVFLIERFENKDLIPNQHAVTAEQLVQEQNLRFVSYTRAKQELVLVSL